MKARARPDKRFRTLCAARGGVASREDHPIGVELKCPRFRTRSDSRRPLRSGFGRRQQKAWLALPLTSTRQSAVGREMHDAILSELAGLAERLTSRSVAREPRWMSLTSACKSSATAQIPRRSQGAALDRGGKRHRQVRRASDKRRQPRGSAKRRHSTARMPGAESCLSRASWARARRGAASGPSISGLPKPIIGFVAALGRATRRSAFSEETAGSTVSA